jgi:BMFP domain-containing protein YqiC
MIDPKLLDDLSQRLAASVPPGLATLQADVARTRQKLEALERQVAELEARAGIRPPGS